MTKTIPGILAGIISIMLATSSVAIAAGMEGLEDVNEQPTKETKKVGTGPNPFSECGIGAALFPTVGWAAVTSNVIWDFGITGLTSATASPETCSGKKVKTAQFIIDNYDNLTEEMAKGQGEHLVAMFDVLGCEPDAQNAITLAIRQNMTEVVSQASYVNHDLVTKASDYYDAVNSAVTGEFESNCSV